MSSPEEDFEALSDLADALLQLLKDGDARVLEKDGIYPRRITETKAGHKKNKKAIIENINQKIDNDSYFDQLKEFLAAQGFKEDVISRKRIYRKRSDWSDPSKSHTSQANALTKKLGPRVSEYHLELFNDCAKNCESGRKALERAIELLAEDLDIK